MSRLIYLDFDNVGDHGFNEWVEQRVKMIASICAITLEIKAIHKTEHGVHVILDAEWEDKKSIEPAETVALQAILGSDFKREAFNLLRAHNLGDAPTFWRDRWNVLYSEKVIYKGGVHG